MDVNIVSQSWVTPSSPTPPHLRNFNLSLLDQFMNSSMYTPIIFFYRHNNELEATTTETKLELLRQSLSDLLPKFYPLAGKIISNDNNFTIDCNDDGVNYIEAQVNCDMNDFFAGRDLFWINKLLPLAMDGSSRVSNIQVNAFECGGIAIGLYVSHLILDGVGLGVFMNSWAATAQGSAEDIDIFAPNFNSVTVFPATDLRLRDLATGARMRGFHSGSFSTNRFVFDSASVSKLRNEVANVFDSNEKPPTRVEAVSAILWKSFIKSLRESAKSEQQREDGRSSVLTHAVNLRPRMKSSFPTITDKTLCNSIWQGWEEAPLDVEPELELLLRKVRNGISKVSEDLAEKLREGCQAEAELSVSKSLSFESSSRIQVTSWCKLGYYKPDFGWGRPVWVGTVAPDKVPMLFNVIILIESWDGEGVEAWVFMDESDLDRMASDPELGKYVKVDPMPFETSSP